LYCIVSSPLPQGLAKRVKARFLLTSTSEVYGDPLVGLCKLNSADP
jgi:hypothetical protein